jgi:hypothetical protein
MYMYDRQWTADEVDWQQTTIDAYLIHVPSPLSNILILILHWQQQTYPPPCWFTLTTVRFPLRFKKGTIISMIMPVLWISLTQINA